MRAIIGTLAILLVTGYLAVTIDLPQAFSNTSAAEVHVTDGWRRTAHGWEWHEAWSHPQAAPDPPPVAWRIHPSVIASWQVLVSLFALLWADRSWSSRRASLTSVRDASASYAAARELRGLPRSGLELGASGTIR